MKNLKMLFVAVVTAFTVAAGGLTIATAADTPARQCCKTAKKDCGKGNANGADCRKANCAKAEGCCKDGKCAGCGKECAKDGKCAACKEGCACCKDGKCICGADCGCPNCKDGKCAGNGNGGKGCCNKGKKA